MTDLRLDPVNLEVVRGQLQGVVEEMGELIMRCGHTVFVKETQDFIVAILTPDGEVAACSQRTGIWIAIGLGFQPVLRAGGPYRPGDVWATNDPEQSKGLVTHLPDTFCWRPIFDGDELVCFVAAHVHCTDVGGLAPGSVAPSAADLYQEGMILPVTKVVEEDHVREDVLGIYLRNSRIPEKNRGDILAMLGTLGRAESRLHQLIAKFGRETITAAMADLLDYAEEQAGDVIADLPDGDYTFWDYLEGDLVPGGRPVRIRLTMKVQNRDLTLDFTGTDPQVAAAYNIATHGANGHYLIVLGVVNYLRTIKPDITYNSGLIRRVHVTTPRGTILNPEENAACGARQATFFRVADVVLGALAMANPTEVPAVGCGQGSIMLVSAPSLDGSSRQVSIAQPLVGGSGGRHHLDGTDGVDFATGFYRNIPTELLEAEVPVLVEEYALRPDSAGSGRLRGGAGLHYVIRFLTPSTQVTARALERFSFQPWGRDGGQPGKVGDCQLTRDGQRTTVGKIDLLEVGVGDVLEFNTAGGGGLGPSWERDVELVLRDVVDGLVSAPAAREEYGVAVVDGCVDVEATQRLRQQLKEQAEDSEQFNYGPYREQFETIWPDHRQLALTAATLEVPRMVRNYIRSALVDEYEATCAERSWTDAEFKTWVARRVDELMRDLSPYQHLAMA